MSVYDVSLELQDKLLEEQGTAVEFEKFPSISRYFREIVITEKIDGSNAQINILDNQEILAGSRNRYITPGKGDHHGFAAWVRENEDSLRHDLGVGRHYGEWWGSGIARGYDLDEKRFSLFNTTRWFTSTFETDLLRVVPLLYKGEHDSHAIRNVSFALHTYGSLAAYGYKNPEGIVIYHSHSNRCFKYTAGDDGPKG